MPRGLQADITPVAIADRIVQGLGKRRIEMAISSKDKLIDYNFGRKGDDREAMHELAPVIELLLEINCSGVWTPKIFDRALLEVDKQFGGRILKGYDPSYLDHLSAVLQRVFVDLGVLRRRQKHQGTRYAPWVEKLLQMVTTDGDGTEDTAAELTDSKVEKMVLMSNYYNTQVDRKSVLQGTPGKKARRQVLQRISEVSSVGSVAAASVAPTRFFPPAPSVVPDPPQEYTNGNSDGGYDDDLDTQGGAWLSVVGNMM